MTKILHITTGEFLVFLSSAVHDRTSNTTDAWVANLEDTFKFATLGMSAEDIISQYCAWNVDKDKKPYLREEFEIVYD